MWVQAYRCMSVQDISAVMLTFLCMSVYVLMHKFLSSLFSFISAAEASVLAALTVFASDLRRVRGSVEAKCW